MVRVYTIIPIIRIMPESKKPPPECPFILDNGAFPLPVAPIPIIRVYPLVSGVRVYVIVPIVRVYLHVPIIGSYPHVPIIRGFHLTNLLPTCTNP